MITINSNEEESALEMHEGNETVKRRRRSGRSHVLASTQRHLCLVRIFAVAVGVYVCVRASERAGMCLCTNNPI